MQTIVLQLDGRGVVWAMPKCGACGQMHKYLVAEVIAHRPFCKCCGRPMDIQGAVITARKDPPRAGVLKPGEGTVDAD